MWSLKFLGQCTNSAARRNSLLKLRLTSYSLRQLEAVVRETGIAFDNRREGLLYYFGSKDAVADADHHMDLLRGNGLDLRTLDRDGVLATEPGLAPIADQIAGAIYSPDCQTGSSYLFANALAVWCASTRAPSFASARRPSGCAATMTGSPALTPTGAGWWPMPTCSPRVPTACSSRATRAWHCRSIR